jgi:hypothetical protein
MPQILATVAIFPVTWDRVLLMIHLLASVFALGAVTHHWWALARARVSPPLLHTYAKWMAFGYALAWVFGVIIYPSYNVLVRKAPLGLLEQLSPHAVGFFEIKEHFGTFALVMLPWLLLSARHYVELTPFERRSYVAATWVFTFFVWFTFVAGGVVTSVRSF